MINTDVEENEYIIINNMNNYSFSSNLFLSEFYENQNNINE